MAALTILQYPDPRLNIVAEPVEDFDDKLKQLVADMFETMYSSKGVGLAATQVDVHKRVVVLDLSEDRSAPMVLVNPEILAASEEQLFEAEGCLSVRQVYERVPRSSRVTVRAKDAEGHSFEFVATEWQAICVQHELDHLGGTVFVEKLSPLKQARVRTKLQKRNANRA